MSKRRKSKKKNKAVKCDEYSHVPSKVAQIINGSFIEKPKKVKKKRLAKSVPRAKRRNFVLPKNKKNKKKKRLAKSKTTKVVPESEEITESAISAQPLNIRTEVAVKLFPETPRKKNSKNRVSGAVSHSWNSKQSRSKGTSQYQASWVARNAQPKEATMSEYEKYENIFVKGRTKRMDVLDHSFDHVVSSRKFLI